MYVTPFQAITQAYLYLETAKLIQSKYRYEICNGLKQYKRKEVYYEQSIKI